MATINKLAVPGAQKAINDMKAEIAAELDLRSNSNSHQSVSGSSEITKRLIKEAQITQH